MKTIFDINSDILYKKPTYTLQSSDDCAPYMVQRWLSFIDPIFCNLLNEIYNVKSAGIVDNQQFYDYLKCIIPTKNVNSIKYIKKAKPIDSEIINESIIEKLSNILEISKNEVREIVKIKKDILDLFKEDTPKVLKKIN